MSKKSMKSMIILAWVGAFGLFSYSSYFVPNNIESKNLSILTWGDILEPEVIQEFEKKFNAKVHLSYYASNEELLVKMKATEGAGYDILIPSDYAVAKLIEHDLVQPLDKKLIPNSSKIDPLLLNQFYDPQNRYSLPFEWEAYGFGYNKNSLTLSLASWDLLFNPDLDFKFVMTNDPNEAIQFASFYLFGPKTMLNPSELNIVIDLLSSSRKRTQAYASFRSDYFLATRSVPLVVASSSYVWRSMKNFPFIGFKIPDEGSFLTIENVCLSKKSKNYELAHKMINFLYSDESMKKHFETFSFFPSTLYQIPNLSLDEDVNEIIENRESLFKKLRFINELSTQEKIQDAWVKIKVSSLP
jgi:spermidine/putrescine transport system substrate-binding protein